MHQTLIFRVVLRKSSGNPNNPNQFLVSIILFTNINISFFSLHFHRFSIIYKTVNQIRNNVVLCCSLPCFCVLLCTHYGPLQCFSTYFRKLKEIGVLRPIFPDYVISCDYDRTHPVAASYYQLWPFWILKCHFKFLTF